MLVQYNHSPPQEPVARKNENAFELLNVITILKSRCHPKSRAWVLLSAFPTLQSAHVLCTLCSLNLVCENSLWRGTVWRGEKNIKQDQVTQSSFKSWAELVNHLSNWISKASVKDAGSESKWNGAEMKNAWLPLGRSPRGQPWTVPEDSSLRLPSPSWLCSGLCLPFRTHRYLVSWQGRALLTFCAVVLSL